MGRRKVRFGETRGFKLTELQYWAIFRSFGRGLHADADINWGWALAGASRIRRGAEEGRASVPASRIGRDEFHVVRGRAGGRPSRFAFRNRN